MNIVYNIAGEREQITHCTLRKIKQKRERHTTTVGRESTNFVIRETISRGK